MKSIIKFTFIIFFLFFFIFAQSKESQKPEWNGKIETENGVKVIRNPREPIYGQIKLDLKEDLSIGGENDKNYMFYRVRGIAVDNQENIYVADMSNFRVQKFDRNGKYLLTIGRKGQGPGEFQQPTKILIDEGKGNIYVQDQVRIKIFDKEGKYLTDVTPKKFPYDFILDRSGVIYAKLESQKGPGELERYFSKVDSNGEIVSTYASFPFKLITYSRGGGGYTGFEYDLLIANIDDETFLYGFSKEYEFNVIDKEGNSFFKIKKDEPNHAYPSSERKRLSKLIEKPGIIFNPPSYIPFFYSLLIDSEKRIYVQTNYFRHEPDANREVDIFSKDGYYLYKTKLPHYTRIIKNGYLYALALNGDEEVKRYKIKNWDQIKTGV